MREEPGTAAAAFRAATPETPPERTPAPRSGLAASRGDDWVLEEDLTSEATEAVRRGRTTRPATGRGRTARAVPAAERETEDIEAEVRQELARAVGPARLGKYEQRLQDASRAFAAERFGDAARILKRLAEDVPGAAAVRELYGLTLYRQGKWRLAAHELEAFRLLSQSAEQHPVLADCYRALRQYGKVDELWEELREASPGAELVTEGRIVAAGALTDRGDVDGAIRLLSQAFTFPKRPKEHHLRRAYALADAYERAGDVVRARELFGRVAAADPELGDAVRRARALG